MQLAPESRAPRGSEVPADPDRPGGPGDVNAHLPVARDFKEEIEFLRAVELELGRYRCT